MGRVGPRRAAGLVQAVDVDVVLVEALLEPAGRPGRVVAHPPDAVAGAAEDDDADAPAGETPAEKKKRKQMAAVLGLQIAPSRCAARLVSAINDLAVREQTSLTNKEHSELKKRLAATDLGEAERAQALAQKAALKARLADLHSQQFRIAEETPVAIAAAIDFMVKDMVGHAIRQTQKQVKNHTVMVSSLHTSEHASTHRMYCETTPYKNYTELNEELLATMRAEQAKLKKAAPKGQKREARERSFITNVNGCIGYCKANCPGVGVRFSNRFREYLDEVIDEVIRRMARWVAVQIGDDARTVKPSHIEDAIKYWMIDYTEDTSTLHGGEGGVPVLQAVRRILEVFRAHKEQDAAAKVLNLTEEKKQARQAKADALAAERRAKQLETARRAADKVAARIAALSAAAAAGAQVAQG